MRQKWDWPGLAEVAIASRVAYVHVRSAGKRLQLSALSAPPTVSVDVRQELKLFRSHQHPRSGKTSAIYPVWKQEFPNVKCVVRA